jgi:ribokinase
MAGKIVFAGSCVTAMTMTCQRFPNIGETITAGGFHTETGGKGTNQALTASRLGSEVILIACVGDDAFGQSILDTHKDFGVNIAGVRIHPTVPTGTAFILVNSDGNNMISVALGANGELKSDDIDNNLQHLKDADLVGFQLETPMEYVEYGVRKASEMGIRTVLDPAPARPLAESLYPCLDFIKPNEVEASLLTGIEVTDCNSAFDAAQWFLDKGVKNAMVTLGEQGVVILNKDLKEHLMPPVVTPKDPTAAGDIFCGAFMHGLASGQDLLESARFAVYASALSVLTLGSTEAIPTNEQVLDFIKSNGRK